MYCKEKKSHRVNDTAENKKIFKLAIYISNVVSTQLLILFTVGGNFAL